MASAPAFVPGPGAFPTRGAWAVAHASRSTLPTRPCRGRGSARLAPVPPVTALAAANGGTPSKPDSDSAYDMARSSGNVMRDELTRQLADRTASSSRVESELSGMSAALNELIAEIRGVPASDKPPVALVPPVSVPSSTTQVTSSSSSSSTAMVNEDVGVEPYMDPSTFGMDSTAGWQTLQSESDLPSGPDGEPANAFRIECDAHGCSLIMQPDAGEPTGAGVRKQFVISGEGYRVGYDPESPRSYCGMVGTSEWLLALDRDEVGHLKRLLLALKKKMRRIASGEEDPPKKGNIGRARRSGDGMFHERVSSWEGDTPVSVELESKLMWVQAFGIPESYGVRVILMERRQVEGVWPAAVVPGLLSAVAKLRIE
ncbi:hypothetical protein MMPV_007398 [Pyropia vietnamensis]